MDETASQLSSRYFEPITDVESENVNVRIVFIVSNNMDPDEMSSNSASHPGPNY